MHRRPSECWAPTVRTPNTRTTHRWRDQRGQAAVELALALPLVVLVALGVLQVALVGRDQLALELAAREAARAASVSADPTSAATTAANHTTTLRPLDISVSVGGDTITVTVSYTNPTNVPFVGTIITNVQLTATATMHLEPP